MARWGILGGSGLTRLAALQVERRIADSTTAWGNPSAPVVLGRLGDAEVVFLARHGDPHVIPPHRVNYRANLWALRESGASAVLAVAAVGGIHAALGPGTLVVPDQLVDYTYGRGHTYYEDELDHVTHIDFTSPYDARLRKTLLTAATTVGAAVIDGGCYAATQGPRLETAGEIRRLERDGCDLVGMTGMPEAALARELALPYACLAVVVNWAAGKTAGEISVTEMERYMAEGMHTAAAILATAVATPPPGECGS